MERKLKICFGCELPRVIWKRHEGKGYCKDCWGAIKTGVATSTLKPTEQSTNKSPIRTPIPSRSPKRIKEEAAYTALRKVFLTQHPFCAMKIVGLCTYNATDVQHKKGRGKYYLDTRFWMPACRCCHNWATDHPAEAIELGFALPRLTEEENGEN